MAISRTKTIRTKTTTKRTISSTKTRRPIQTAQNTKGKKA